MIKSTFSQLLEPMLSDQDSNLDRMDQNHSCCLYTIGQTNFPSKRTAKVVFFLYIYNLMQKKYFKYEIYLIKLLIIFVLSMWNY
jgi:hypothetical protein